MAAEAVDGGQMKHCGRALRGLCSLASSLAGSLAHALAGNYAWRLARRLERMPARGLADSLAAVPAGGLPGSLASKLTRRLKRVPAWSLERMSVRGLADSLTAVPAGGLPGSLASKLARRLERTLARGHIHALAGNSARRLARRLERMPARGLADSLAAVPAGGLPGSLASKLTRRLKRVPAWSLERMSVRGLSNRLTDRLADRLARSPACILAGRLARNCEGVTLIEVAFLFLPFTLLVFAIIEGGIAFAVQQSLTQAAGDVARRIRTGQLPSADMTEEMLRGELCDRITFLLPNSCSGLLIDLRHFETFAELSDVRIELVGTGADRDINTAGFRIDPGGSGSKNLMRVFYRWPIHLDLLRRLTATVQGDSALLYATVAWQNEPFRD